MSMLSAQVDELRTMAESVSLAMPRAATLMMEAADTIWELRCKCAGMVDMRERARLAETENAKLREELESVGTAAYLYGCSDLKDENTEQAISNDCTNSEQTNTCQNVAPWYLDFLCSKCGFVHYHSDENDTNDRNEWHFCPNCGRRVEVDE